MGDRPKLSKDLKPEVFREYYYLKKELVDFCRESGLKVSGGKEELTRRIEHFLKTGEDLLISKKSTKRTVVRKLNEITLDTLIEDGFVCSEEHRAFFKGVIGDGFKFNVKFQQYLKKNAGRQYSEAVDAWYRIQEEKKNCSKKDIGKQFEYNTYIRDFFKDNPGSTLKEAIKCWKFKKGEAGSNKYEKEDLRVLNVEK